MRKKLLPEAEQYVKRNTRRRGWRKVVQAMACAVVFCTTYALILPAITMEKECTLAEHTHDENCYAQVTVREERKLECSYERLGIHIHEEDCYNAENELICTMADYVVHEHSESCWDEAGSLVCALPEVKVHKHTREECWQEIEGTSEHVHEEGCYQTERGELLCQIPEEEGHTHGENCYILSEEPVCGMEEMEGHAHDDACTQRTLVCGESTEEAHSHESSCYEAQLICGETEAESYTYEEEYEETVLICENEAEDHEHEDSCYQTEVTVVTVTIEGHSHSDSCYEEVLVCEKSTEPHVHGDSCYEVSYSCGLTETEGHSHSRDCYDSTIICEKEEREGHTHGDDCYEKVTTLICEAEKETEPEYEFVCEEEEILLHSHEDACYEITTDENGEEQKNLICPRTVVEEHIHGDDCFVMEQIPVDTETLICTEAEAHVHGEGCYDEAGALVCTESTEGHVHSAMCYGTWELVCGMEEHVHDAICSPILGLSEEHRAQVENVIALIDEMPSADEIDAKIAEFEEAEDYEGEEEWLTEVYQQVARVYAAYSALGEELQGYVTNADKLLELEYIWSVVTLDDSTPSKIYQINTYSSGDVTQTSGTVMYVGTPVGNSGNQAFVWWKEVVVEWQNGYMRVAKIYPADGATSKIGHQASDAGFILLFHDGMAQGFPHNVTVGDYVSLDFFIHQTRDDVYAYNANGYGSVTFTKAPPDYSITSAPTTVLQYQENGGRVAHTSDFVDLNLYNYNYNVNDNWRNNNYYPGFQWPGGAFTNNDNGETNAASTWNIGRSNWSVDRHYIDSVNFGDSIVANHQYANSKSEYDGNENGKYGKAVNATNVGRLYTNSNAQLVGKINLLWYDKNVTDSTTNRPAGFTTTGKAVQFKMNNGAPITVDGISLKYLFPSDIAAGTTNANGVTKLNSQSVDGLFQVNPVSGLYYYNSRDNHAQYSENKFTLYDEIITPNFILYPFGNFLPFNNINTQATQVGAFNNSGGMKTYVNGTVFDLQKWMANQKIESNYPWEPFSTIYGYSSRYQLGIMLNEYAESWHNVDSGATWNSLTSGEALSDFFRGTQGPADAAPSFPQTMLDNIYNIDWDQPTDFFFGMDMSMSFLMPKNGLTGHDNGNNTTGSWTVLSDGTFKRTGEPDGIPDYPMVFNFAGDDDVWVYVDGMLFLDLTGIHRHVGGTIDFETGMIYYFPLETATGDTTNNTAQAGYYYAETFEELIRRSFTDNQAAEMNALLDTLRPVLDANGNQRYFKGDTSRPMKTFKDYTTHTFKFFYMERGSGSSVCRMNFNFPTLRKNSITVSKKNVPDEATIKAMGNPDYYFNIIKKDESGLFVLPGTQYMILDQYGNEIGTGVVDEHGIFTIKAGQTAVFNGITENAGDYYVQELIKDEDYLLYDGKVTVNDGPLLADGVVNWAKRNWYSETNSDTVNNEDYTGPYGHKWHFYSSQYTNASASSTFFFEMQNGVITKNLGKLSISKVLEADITNPAVDTVYKMHVELDGEPLAVGTPYTIGENAYTVAERGIIPLKTGETATIGNIISGTQFEVWEDSGSAAGYFVSYDSENAEEERNGTSASGIIRVNTEVSVAVTNSENAAKVEIPVTKQLSNGAHDPDTTHTYRFALTRTDKSGEALSGDQAYSQTLDLSVTGTSVEDGVFGLAYSNANYSADTIFPVTYYYRITENDQAENTITDNSEYRVAVTVDRDDNGKISAELTSLTLKGNSVNSADFVNTLTSGLTLKKLVEGSPAAMETESFRFTLKVTYNGEPLVGTFPAIYHNKDGTVESTATLDEEGMKVFEDFHHNEFVEILGLPLGAEWEITEMNADNYIVSWEVNDSGETQSSTAAGTIHTGETSVVFTNTSTYTLPETGGAGTTPYTMAGLVLICFSMAYLMYRSKARRREEFESP